MTIKLPCEQLSGLKTGASRDPFGIVASSPPIRVSTSLRRLAYSIRPSSKLLSARTFPRPVGDVTSACIAQQELKGKRDPLPQGRGLCAKESL
jgi:hypothetical protein